MNNLYKSLTVIAILFVIGVAYYNYKTSTYVTAEFKNLRPFHNRAPVYYNGFKIGNVVGVRPNKTYTSTIVKMRLYPCDLHLPVNVSANLKKERNFWNRKFDYIDLIYPTSPSIYYLDDGDRISGKTTVDFESYLANQDPESIDAMKADMAETIKNLNVTVQTLGDLFATLNSMAGDVKPNVVKASKDISESTSNIVKISSNAGVATSNLNEAFNEQRLDSTAKNFQIVSRNVKLMTNELNNTLPQVGCTINEINRVLCNIDEMTAGLNCTMKKPFGGLRLIFGSPVGKKCDCRK